MRKLFFVFFILIFLFSCGKRGVVALSDNSSSPDNKTLQAIVTQDTSKNIVDNKSTTDKKEVKKVITNNSPLPVKQSPPQDSAVAKKKNLPKKKIDLVFDNVDVYEVISNILGDILNKDFVVDPSIKTKMAMRVSGNYTDDEIIEIVTEALDVAGLTLLFENNIYKVILNKDTSKNVNFRDPANMHSIEVIQLKHIGSFDIVNNLKPFLSNGAAAVSVNASNSIIIADKKGNISNIKKIIEILDSQVFEGLIFKVLKFQHITAQEAKKMSDEILKSQAIFSKTGILKDVFVYPIVSNNSILVIGKEANLVDMMVKWIKEADVPEESYNSRVFVVPISNVKAEELANILKQLYGGKATKTKEGKVIVQGASFNKGSLNGEVFFIPDSNNNFIIIRSSVEDYNIIYDVLKKLDVVPKQVLIDLLIAEISYNNSLKYGIQWYLKNNGIKIDGDNFNAGLNLNSGTGVPARDDIIGSSSLIGFSYALYDKAGGIRGLLNAIQDKSDVQILASPSILSVDNKEAKIEIGEEVPIITSSVTNVSSDGNITNSVQYRKTGILLSVKPQINPLGLVRLEVKEEVSEPKKNVVSGIDSPSFLKRSAETSLVAYDSQTIVIGGLIKNKIDNSNSGVPLLSDIPVLGYLFGSKNKSDERTELIIAITPHIINLDSLDTYYSKELFDGLKNIMKHLDERKESVVNGIKLN